MIDTEMSNYIHLSKYSRWVPEKKRRETWEETVERLISFWRKRWGHVISEEVFEELKMSIIDKEVMPSMRTLMTAGPALERDEAAGFNPVTGDTRVLTREYGYVPISDLEGKEATVLNCNGEWADATFKSYGCQPTYLVTLKKNSNTLVEVRCTGNHRWLTTEGVVKHTDELMCGKNGDKIPFSSYKREVSEDNLDYKLGVAHGIVYADGTRLYSQERVKGYVVRLCGSKNSLLKHLVDVGGKPTYPPSFSGDAVVQFYGDFPKTHDLKSLPSIDETEEYLIGFVRGWLAGDGSLNKSRGTVTICGNKESKEWLEKFSGVLGYVIQHVKEQPKITNFGERSQSSYVLTIDRSSLTPDDVLDESLKGFLRPLESRFSVFSVEPTGVSEKVWCASVPDTNTFVLERGLVTGNCWSIGISTPRCFDEMFYLLMCGGGVGFSVEEQYISQLPKVAEEFYESTTTIKVRDSKIGWAKGLKELISLLYGGNVPTWDLSAIRPAGARLKVFGGRASGPSPLNKLFRMVVNIFKGAAGRRLNSLEVHDICCWIAMTVIVGSVRRSACISLTDLHDDLMRRAKMGSWYYVDPQRALANNSVAYKEKPDISSFAKEFGSMYTSKAGERGMVNKAALRKKAEECGREHDGDYLVNPCSEAVLRDTGGCCNLSEAIIRPEDTLDTLRRKVRLATILGTLQSTLSDFRYLRKVWKQNQEEERLLGVSFTGIMDHPVMSGRLESEWLWFSENPAHHSLPNVLTTLKEEAIRTNREYADLLGINHSKQLGLVRK